MSKLFSPIQLKQIKLKNRIVMSPMCMYQSTNKDGHLTPFHYTHYVSRAVGQVGLIMLEATAVLPEGRISDQDLGIWSDAHISDLKQLNEQMHTYGSKTGIQLAHAGRKAGIEPPIFAPSAIPFNGQSIKPTEMTSADIQHTIAAFTAAARRAKEANFDMIELHGAHGYLINEFLSPLTNQRTDEYGGNRENRYRFLREIIAAVKAVWHGPLFVRISADEYADGGNTIDDFIYFVNQMKNQGIDLIDCSTGGVVPARIDVYPGYQVRYSDQIKSHAQIMTGAVGLLTNGKQAEDILQQGQADLIFIGRALLRNPYWAKAAADDLGYSLQAPSSYERGWRL